MSARAYAIANNDIIHIAWSFDHKLSGCTGFRIYRLTEGGAETGTPLKSLIAFDDRRRVPGGSARRAALPHDEVNPSAPPTLIKGFHWRDLLRHEDRGVKVRYRIVAVRGTQQNATPLPGQTPLLTNWVTPTPHMGTIDAYFNRGILSTQA